jgi:hypothetical protein
VVVPLFFSRHISDENYFSLISFMISLTDIIVLERAFLNNTKLSQSTTYHKLTAP